MQPVGSEPSVVQHCACAMMRDMATTGNSTAALELARAQGMVGGDLEAHIAHARGFAVAQAELVGGQPTRVVDLGSGGGLPAFVLIELWPRSEFLLVEGRSKRAELLSRGCRLMGVTARVQVHSGDAQLAMVDPAWHQQADVVTARSFASPAIAAECAAHFLVDGGWAIISEPPGGDPADRWAPAVLGPLGLSARPVRADGHNFVGLQKTNPLLGPPRNRKAMEKKPLG